MDFFKNLKIGTRLGLGFAIVILAAIAIAGYARISLGMVKGELDLLTDDRIVKIEQLTDVKNNLNIIARRIRNIALMSDEAEMAKEKKDIEEARARNSELLKKLDATIKAPKARVMIEKLAELRAKYNAVVDKTIAAGMARSDTTRDLLLVQLRPVQNAYFEDLDALIAFQHGLMKESSDAVEAQVERASVVMIGIAFLAALGGAFIAWSSTRSVTRPIGEAVKLAEAVAAGDLTATVEIHSKDETGQLLAALRRMNESLQNIVGQVRTSSDSIATGSQQIATGNTDLSQRTEEQASNLQQTAASMEQLTSTVKNNAGTAQEANRMAGSASATAAKGGEAMLQVVSTMEEISGASKKIADIISVIDGIAFQTNILALNAAVEAARAGEQGRGFAVVASEVRNLAQRSATAAKEIKTLIGDSVEKVNNGTKLVSDAGRTMDEIVNQVKHVSQLINEISAATGEQTSGIEQIGEAVTQLDQVTQQNAALVEESAAAAESLKDQAFKLTEAVSVFKIAGH